MVPFPCMRISWTAPSGTLRSAEATTAYVLPFAAIVSTSAAVPSAAKVPVALAPPPPSLAHAAAISLGAAWSISTSCEADSEPGEPGGGSEASTTLPAGSSMRPDRAPVPR